MYSAFDMNQRKLALFKSIVGASESRVAHLGVEAPGFLSASYDDYEATVEEVFHPRSERNLARAEFLARKQGAAENVSTPSGLPLPAARRRTTTWNSI